MTGGLDWIFFDLGSTLIDESAAADFRIDMMWSHFILTITKGR